MFSLNLVVRRLILKIRILDYNALLFEGKEGIVLKCCLRLFLPLTGHFPTSILY